MAGNNRQAEVIGATGLLGITCGLPVSRNLTADSCPVPRRLLPATGQLGVDSQHRFKLSRVVALTKRQETILETIDRVLLKAQN